MTISFGIGDSMKDDAFLFDQIDQRLADIPLLHRSKEMRKAFKAGADAVAKRYAELLPRSIKQKVPGTPVAEMPDEKVKEYETAITGLAGVERGRKMARVRARDMRFPTNIESLLEAGHRIVVRGTAAQKIGARQGYASPSYHRDKEKAKARRGAGQVVGRVAGGRYLQKAIDQVGIVAKGEIITVLDKAIDRLTA